MIREGAAVRAAARLWRRLARLLPPQDCWLCQGYSRGLLLCAFCRRDLPRRAAGLDLEGLASDCGLDALVLRYDYRFPMDVLITRYKYGGELALGAALAALLPAPPRLAAPPSLAPRSAPFLVCAPPTGRRLAERGYDHMRRLAQRYGQRHGLPLAVVTRTREVPPQASLSRRARRDNLRDAFRIAQPLDAALILDDVLTTGATLAALAQASRAAGAQWVGAVVLARTPAAHELRPETE